ncbi:SOB five-like 2 [Raphanus sativus]|uniref:Protein SOB FIVE-LIKE 2-like n=1 Tax=Raphanus sativus TaxID=3726 RepID=A0A9W3D5M8_RAPSA|nr:protein SOB FIVE-LIKE 2-like [Raphanus sativus]KAJ4909715.1 SOB five-like 2 [Raphanus sativus]
MESPRIHEGVAEEKSSCESGWTMYIEDSFHGNHQSEVVYEEYVDDGNHFRVKYVDDDSSENGSDDSMTSDASSWPSTQLPRKTKNQAAAKNSSAKQVNHHPKNRACEKSTDQEEDSEFKGRTRTTAASRVRSRGKVRKTR